MRKRGLSSLSVVQLLRASYSGTIATVRASVFITHRWRTASVPQPNHMPVEFKETSEQKQQRLTIELSEHLTQSRLKQQFEPVVMWNRRFDSPIPFVLILQLDKSYIRRQFVTTVYQNEPHILGKAARLLVYLEETDKLFTLIKPYNVVSIMITTASDPTEMNDSNKFVLEAKFAERTIQQLITLKGHSQSVFNAAIASFVDENTKR